MKKTILSILILLFSSSLVQAQDWFQIDIGTSTKLNAIDFPTSQVGYIAGDSSVLFKSTDGGASWNQIIHNGLVNNPNQSIREIQFLSNDVGFAVTQGTVGGIFKTTDGGINWAQLPDTMSNGFCFQESIYMFDETNGVFGGNGCFSGSIIERIVNNEYEETNVNLFTGVYQTTADLDFQNPNIGLATTKSKYIYRTTDGGQNWDTIPTGLENGRVTGVKFVNGDTCFASFDTQSNAFGILRSNDGGLTWVQDGNSATFFYPYYHCVSKTDQAKVYVGAEPSAMEGGLIFSSADYVSWNYEYVDQAIFDIDSYGNDTVFAVGDSGYLVVNQDLSTLSIQEYGELFKPEVYPNPSSGHLTVLSNENIENVRIYSEMGQIVFQLEGLNTTSTEIDLSSIEKGIYILKLEINGMIQTKKIILE